MKTEHIYRKRVSPYVTTPVVLNKIMGHMAGVKVRHALCAGWGRAKEMAYTALKLSPIAYALAPNPVTGALAVVNAVDTLIRVRNGDKVGLLEAGLVALSSIQGAAAQVTFTRTSANTIGASNSDSDISCSGGIFRSSTETNRTEPWPNGLGEHGPGYGYCAITGSSSGLVWANRLPDPNVPVLPIAPNLASMEGICTDAASACQRGSIVPRPTTTQSLIPSSTLARSTAEPTSTAFSQSSTGAVASSTPTATECPPISQGLPTSPPQPNRDALYAATAAAFGFGVGVGALATCGAAILRSKKADEEQTDQPNQPVMMTHYARPRLISEASNRSDASDLTLSPVYGESALEIHAAHEVERRDEVERIYEEINYAVEPVEPPYVEMRSIV